MRREPDNSTHDDSSPFILREVTATADLGLVLGLGLVFGLGFGSGFGLGSGWSKKVLRDEMS